MQLKQALDNLFKNQESSIHNKHFSNSNYKRDNVNEGIYNDEHFDNEDIYHHHSSDDSSHGRPLELSIMASLKQVKGNSGTLFSLMHYSHSDGGHHR